MEILYTMTETGFLTTTDREFLRGEKEYNTKQQRYQRRQAIRERTRAAFRDFSLLYETVDKAERERIFCITGDPLDTDGGLERDTRDGLVDTLAFLYLSLEGVEGDAPPWITPGVPRFHDILESAISKAESDRRPDTGIAGPYVSTELTVDVVDDVDTSAAAEKLARGDVHALSEAELRALVQTAYHNTNDFALEPLIDAKREELGMDPEEIRREVKEWFDETYLPESDDEDES